MTSQTYDHDDDPGRALVRSIWRADVEPNTWEPRFEIRYRRLVPADDLLRHWWIEDGFEALHHRVLIEAGILAWYQGP